MIRNQNIKTYNYTLTLPQLDGKENARIKLSLIKPRACAFFFNVTMFTPTSSSSAQTAFPILISIGIDCERGNALSVDVWRTTEDDVQGKEHEDQSC